MLIIVCSSDTARGERYAQTVAHTQIVEPPGRHHPKFHAPWGDQWLRVARKYGNDTIAVFTHSEVAILRIMRRITDKQVSCDEVEFHVYDPKTGAFVVIKPYIRFEDSEAEFDKRWPEGFFDERGDELFGDPLPPLEA